MVPLPEGFLNALAGRDEMLVSSRTEARTGTVPMSFVVAPPGVVYLLTAAFSRKAQRWESDPWVRLTVPGTDVAVEAAARPVSADELDTATEALILDGFTAAGATTPEALRQMLDVGTHVLLRVEGRDPSAAGEPVP